MNPILVNEAPPDRVIRFRMGGTKWICRTEAVDLVRLVGKWSESDWIGSQGSEIIRARGGRTSLLFRSQPSSRPVFVKVTRYLRLRKRIRSLYHTSDSKHEWNLALSAWRVGLPTPAPLGMGERRRAGMLVESYHITEALEGVRSPSTLLRSAVESGLVDPPDADKRDFISKFGALVRTLHDHDFLHRQFSPTNLLVGEDETGRQTIWFVDNRHLEFRERSRLRERNENLARIYFHWLSELPAAVNRAGNLLRFLNGYRKAQEKPAKDHFREIRTYVFDLAGKYERRGILVPSGKRVG